MLEVETTSLGLLERIIGYQNIRIIDFLWRQRAEKSSIHNSLDSIYFNRRYPMDC